MGSGTKGWPAVTWIFPGTETNNNNSNDKVQKVTAHAWVKVVKTHDHFPSFLYLSYVMMSSRRCLQVREPDKGGSTLQHFFPPVKIINLPKLGHFLHLARQGGYDIITL